MLQLFYDVEHYHKTILRFEQAHQPFLADVARLFLFIARLSHEKWSSASHEKFLLEVEVTLQRMDQATTSVLGSLDEQKDLIQMFKGFMHMAVASRQTMPVSEKCVNLDKGAAIFRATPLFHLRIFEPLALWSKAQLFQGRQNEEFELAATQAVNRLMAAAAREKEALPRTVQMAQFAMLPAAWKFDKGDFVGAMEHASSAKSFAESAMITIEEELRPTIDEITRAIGEETTDPAERDALTAMRDALVASVQSANMLIHVNLILMATARAKIAERAGDFSEAAAQYDEAAHLQKTMVADFKATVAKIFGAMATPAGMMIEQWDNPARAASLTGMALLNRGDQAVLRGEHSASLEHYRKARESFEDASDCWLRETERLPETNKVGREKAQREHENCLARQRYCDAKILLAEAEHLSARDQAWDAAKKFENASRIFQELLAASDPNESARNLDVLKASRDFCRARWILGTIHEKWQDEDAKDGIQLLQKASSRFDTAGELRWSRCAQGLSQYFEAVSASHLATSVEGAAREKVVNMANDKARDAAATFRQAGFEERAREVEIWASGNTTRFDPLLKMFALPKLVDSFEAANNPAQGLLGQYTPEFKENPSEKKVKDRLRSLQARAMALDGSLKSLKERGERGRVDLGQYTELSTDLDRERIEILMEINSIQEGKSVSA